MKPGTWLTPSTTSGTHSPVPSNAPSDGSAPVPVISATGESPVNRATYRLPAVSSVLLCRRARTLAPGR